jgi:hypothetical protein
MEEREDEVILGQGEINRNDIDFISEEGDE